MAADPDPAKSAVGQPPQARSAGGALPPGFPPAAISRSATSSTERACALLDDAAARRIRVGTGLVAVQIELGRRSRSRPGQSVIPRSAAAAPECDRVDRVRFDRPDRRRSGRSRRIPERCYIGISSRWRTAGRQIAPGAEQRAGPGDPPDGARSWRPHEIAPRGAVYLEDCSARGGAYDFSYSYAPNRWQPLKLGEDGTILSTKRAGGFVGAVFGLYAHDPHAKERRRCLQVSPASPCSRLRSCRSGHKPKQPLQIAITFDDLPLHGPIPRGRDAAIDCEAGDCRAEGRARHQCHGHDQRPMDGHAARDDRSRFVSGEAAGLPLGNHTWSHPNLNQLTAARVRARRSPTTSRCLRSSNPAATGSGSVTRFSRKGDDPAKRAEVRKYLAGRGYKIAAVTTDFGDWQWTAPLCPLRRRARRRRRR